MPFEAAQARRKTCLFPRLTVTIPYFFGESYDGRNFGWRATATSKANLPVTDMGLKERHRLHGDAKKHVSARQGLYLKISKNRRAGCLQERK